MSGFQTISLRQGSDTIMLKSGMIYEDVSAFDWAVFTITGQATPPDNPGAEPDRLNWFRGIVHLASTRELHINVDFSLPTRLRVGQQMYEFHPALRGCLAEVYLNGRNITSHL